MADHVPRLSVGQDATLVEQDHPSHSRSTDGIEWETKSTVRPLSPISLHPAEALLLELGVADGEHLVDEQDLRFEVGGHGEGEAQVHPARVALDRRVEEPRDPGELDDLVELRSISRRRMPRMAPLR